MKGFTNESLAACSRILDSSLHTAHENWKGKKKKNLTEQATQTILLSDSEVGYGIAVLR